MTSDDLKAHAHTIFELARSEWEKEKDGGFPTLSRIPSSWVKRQLEFYASLDPKDAQFWTDFRLAGIPAAFFREWRPEQSENDVRRHVELCDVLCGRLWSWDASMSLRMIKTVVRSSDAGEEESFLACIPPDKLAWIRSVEVAKASELRRLIKPLFKNEFDLIPTNKGGGTWTYSSENREDSLRIDLDFGGRDSQLRHSVCLNNPFTNTLARFSYEVLLGLTPPDWNWISEQDAQQACELLVELVSRSLDFAQRAFAAIGAT